MGKKQGILVGASEVDGTRCGRNTGSHWVLDGPGPLRWMEIWGHLLGLNIFVVLSRRSREKKQQTHAEQLLQDRNKETLEGAPSFPGTPAPHNP